MLWESLTDVYHVQEYMKLFLYLILVSNGIILIWLNIVINIEKKIKLMFNLESIKDIQKNDNNKKIGTVLIIIAHPDDEIMFLSPTLKKLSSLKIKVKILCLSNGNYDGIGHIRTEEFLAVGRELKLEDNEILHDPDLQDNIKKFWDEKIVAKKIEDFLNKNQDIETIITFDERGVTKHPNHISCYNGLEYYLKTHREEVKAKKTSIYLFDSFSPLTQYTFLVPALFFFRKENGFATWNCCFSYKFMSIYKSQFNIMRRLHVILSGYSYFNSFTKVELK